MKFPDLPVTFQELKVNYDGAFPLCESKNHSLWFNPADRSSPPSSLINSSMSFNCCSSSGSKVKRLIVSKASYSQRPQKLCARFLGRKSYLSFKRSKCTSAIFVYHLERSVCIIVTEFKQMWIFGL